MKIIKKTVLFFLVLIVLLGIGIYIYLLSTKPIYEGEIGIKNISKETSVHFDDYGVPHIYASNEKDAQTVLGYVHAQDRLWQMELLRRIAPGRLSEIFGIKALDNDKLFLALGIDENSEQAIAKLDKNGKSYQLAMAYLDGINQYIENGKTPVEFTLLGIKKEKFTLKDVYNTYGYMSFSFAMAQKTDPLLTDLKNKLGDQYVQELGVDLSFNLTKLKTNQGNSIEEYIQASKAVADLLESSPVPPFIGSNSWVLSPKKTATGKVLFANDPHIAYSQPGTWYEAHIVCPEQEMYGYYLAGTPYPLLGHNRNYAYGLTMFENDDADFYQEQRNPSNPNEYKTKNGFAKFGNRSKVIKVKDSASFHLAIQETNHGPIMNGVLRDFNPKAPVTFNWIYTHKENKILDAVYHLCHTKNANDFNKNIALIVAPGLNIMYGDAQNNIAWQTSGKLYKFKEGINSNFLLNGYNGIDDAVEYLDFSKNPKAINPEWNYVYTANNMPQAIDGYNYPGYYLPEDRAKRIESLLISKSDWKKEDVSKMILDNKSSLSPQIVRNLISGIQPFNQSETEKKAIAILQKWDGSNSTSDIAPTIYNKWIFYYLRDTFKDEMGATGFKQFLKTHIMKQCVANQSKNEKSVWWDDFTTKNKKETRSDILTKAFKETIANLEIQLGNDLNTWAWGRVHQVEYKHPIGQVALLRPFFNVGIFEAPGANEVINNVMYEYTEDAEYTVTGGPSTRRVIDFSNIENSWSILPTGQSGNPMSKHYNDQAQMYIEGKFRKMKMNKKEIEATSTKLVFIPK